MRFPTKPCESEEKHRERKKERMDGWMEKVDVLEIMERKIEREEF